MSSHTTKISRQLCLLGLKNIGLPRAEKRMETRETKEQSEYFNTNTSLQAIVSVHT